MGSLGSAALFATTAVASESRSASGSATSKLIMSSCLLHSTDTFAGQRIRGSHAHRWVSPAFATCDRPSVPREERSPGSIDRRATMTARRGSVWENHHPGLCPQHAARNFQRSSKRRSACRCRPDGRSWGPVTPRCALSQSKALGVTRGDIAVPGRPVRQAVRQPASIGGCLRTRPDVGEPA